MPVTCSISGQRSKGTAVFTHLETAVALIPSCRASRLRPYRVIASLVVRVFFMRIDNRRLTQLSTHRSLRAVHEAQTIPMVYRYRPPLGEHDGHRLLKLLARADVQQTLLADIIGVSKPAVSKWIKTGGIAREHVAEICRVLDAFADELLGLSPIVNTRAVAEARVDYALLDAGAKALVKKYTSASEESRAALIAVSKILIPEEESSAV